MELPEPFERAVARAVAALPRPVLRALGGRPVRIDGEELDPEVRLGVRLAELGGPPLDRLSVSEARAQVDRNARVFAGSRIEIGSVEELTLPGRAGDRPARLYRAGRNDLPAPLLLWLHGGGWVVGGLDTHDQLCRFLAQRTGAVVLALDYRLAPEHPFPAALEDTLAAARFAHAEARSLGVDAARIAIGGDSAGGNLAAVACLELRDAGEPLPAAQILVYPVTDASRRSRSYELFAEGFLLTRSEMEWYTGHYLPDPGAASDPRVSPLLADDLSGLPPAHVLTCGFDVLRDEGEAYAERLRGAGVPVGHRREGGLVHGFVNAVGLGGVAGAATARLAAAIRSGVSL